MEQEILKPEPVPKGGSHASGPLGSFMSAAGVTLLVLTKLGAAGAATIWAFSKLFGFPELVMWALMALLAIPVLWATIWTAGRAWHVEQRLERGLDVDTPVFKIMHYWKKA